METRAFVIGPDGRRYKYLLVLDGDTYEVSPTNNGSSKVQDRFVYAQLKGDRDAICRNLGRIGSTG